MRLVFLTIQYPSESGWGGIGTYTHHIARGMRRLGHDVTVLCQARAEPREYVDTEGIRIVSRQFEEAGLNATETVRQELETIMRSLKPDIIEGAEYRADLLSFQHAHPAFPVVVRLHLGTQMCALGNAPWWKRTIRQLVPARAVKNADLNERESTRLAHGVTSCSAWVRDMYQAQGWRFPPHTQVIANPISDRAVDLERKDYHSPRVVTVGRLDRLKGAPLFPAIIRRVLSEYPTAQFVIAGDDLNKQTPKSWQHRIESQLPEPMRAQVKFLGSVPHAEISGVLDGCNAAFFASEYENFPYTHVEAMQAGLACVLASPGGSRELGVHGKSVLQVERRSDAIAEAIVSLLKSPDDKRKIGINGAAHVKSMWTNDIIGSQAASFYQQVLESGRK